MNKLDLKTKEKQIQFYEKVGLYVKSKMVLAKATQQEVADYLDISRVSLLNKLSGRFAFTVDEIILLINRVGIEFNEIVRLYNDVFVPF